MLQCLKSCQVWGEEAEEHDQSSKTSVIDRLQSLKIEFQQYFPDYKEEAALARNTFSTSLFIANITDE